MIFPDMIETETGGVACYIKKDLYFNTRTLHCKKIKNFSFNIHLPKWKPITIGVFCGPPNQVNCLDLMVEKFTNLNLKDNDRYLLGDFIIHLYENGKYILNGKRTTNSQGSFHTLRNIYKQDILSNILFKAINSMSYLCNMQHLLSY